MTIQELANRAEVTTRTIRYYVEQGVLPPPEYGRPAEYTEEHVVRLALIKRLKEQYLPLDEIRDTLQRLSLADVQSLVADYSPQQEQTKKLDSAADYIANVLGRGAVREQMKQASTRSFSGTPQPPEPVLAPAPAQAAPGTAGAPMPSAQAAAATPAAPARTLASRLRSSVAGRRSSSEQAKASAATAKDEAAYIEPPASWQRVQLGEGIELHYVASSDAQFNEMVTRLLEAAHLILDEGPGNGE